jgi:hypothetical protein
MRTLDGVIHIFIVLALCEGTGVIFMHRRGGSTSSKQAVNRSPSRIKTSVYSRRGWNKAAFERLIGSCLDIIFAHEDAKSRYESAIRCKSALIDCSQKHHVVGFLPGTVVYRTAAPTERSPPQPRPKWTSSLAKKCLDHLNSENEMRVVTDKDLFIVTSTLLSWDLAF